MATRRQNTLSPSSSSRLASGRLTASQNRAGRPVRWGAAVVESARPTTTHSWKSIKGRVRRERRAAVRLQGGLPLVAGVQDSVGGPGGAASSAVSVEVRSFTRNRIRHAFDLFGACMMIVTFLAMAMFA